MINNKPAKIKRKDEFKEFLKEILKQYKDKNAIRVKKKIDINILLNNKQAKSQNKLNIKANRTQFNEGNLNLKGMKTYFNNYKKEKSTIILKNEFLNSKLSKKSPRMLTEDIKNKKRNIFDNYRLKKHKKALNEVEEELINIENKIRISYDKFKKNIDDERTDIL